MRNSIVAFFICFMVLSCEKPVREQAFSASIDTLQTMMQVNKIPINVDSANLKWWVYSTSIDGFSGLGPSDQILIVTFKIDVNQALTLANMPLYKYNVGFPVDKRFVKEWYPPSILVGLNERMYEIRDAEFVIKRPYKRGYFFVTLDNYVFIYMAT